jgi:glycosyltransferase involved in cell wall biosynthesis
MKIAFYAPMKSPNHPQPSGDRTIGRLLIQALQSGECEVQVASELRTWSANADHHELAGFQAAAAAEAEQLLDCYRAAGAKSKPQCWLTYHNYYKAPDLLGPIIADGLGIPYVIVEASYARRRASGEWSAWLDSARYGIERADAIFCFTARDKAGLAEICQPDRLHDLAPFLSVCGRLGARQRHLRHASDTVRLVSVAMMRHGAKFTSYRILAAALRRIVHLDWSLEIIGDGAARGAVEAAFEGFGDGRITFHGVLERESLNAMLAGSDVFVWPGIEEAFGMAFLEAQTAELPVVAIDTAGVSEVVRHGETGLLSAGMGPAEFAENLGRLITDPLLRARLGDGARASIERNHGLAAASARLSAVLVPLVGGE